MQEDWFKLECSCGYAVYYYLKEIKGQEINNNNPAPTNAKLKTKMSKYF